MTTCHVIILIFLLTSLTTTISHRLIHTTPQDHHHQSSGIINDAGTWTRVPVKCVKFVEKYMKGERYNSDSEVIASYALPFAKSVAVGNDGKDVWVFDIDKTLLSKLSYYVDHAYGTDRTPSPQPRLRKEGGVFNRLGRKEPSTSTRSGSRRRSPHAKRNEMQPRHQQKGTPSHTTNRYSESEDSEGGHWKSKSRRHRSNTYEDDLSQPWTCEERNPFTPRIRHFSLPRTRMPNHVKTYDGSGDPEDHLKLFQSAAKTEGWAMPTWCHMFNSTFTGNARVWFDKLPKESVDSYEDLRTAFRENYLQQTKHIKDPVEIHHIKQRDGESTEDFMERYKSEVLDVEGAPECMRISGFMHGITHPGLIKRLYERIPRSMDEMYRMTTSFLQGEVAASNHGPKKTSLPWKQSEGGDKPNFKKGFKNKEAGSVDKPRITQSFSPETAMSFPPLGKEDGTEGPMIIEAEMGEHFVHRVYVDGGASSEVLSPSQHNAIIGRPGIRKIRAVPSTAHGMLKFPVKGGTVTLQSSKVIPMECVMISGPSIQSPVANQIPEEKINIAIHPEYPEQTVAIGSTLTEKGRKELCSLLKQNLDIFAWKPANMTGVPRNIAEHRLNIREGYSPVRQKKKGQAPERNKVIQEEVENLVEARIMKEVHYHSWLSNPMPFGLKNVGTTYQRLVDKAFQRQIGRSLEINMKLNLKKRTFRMQEGMFLGYKVSTNGLRACPDKADTVLSLPSLRCIKDVQKLNGKLASLNRFLSKSAEKSLPFFKTLKKCTKKSDFQWTPEAEEAFKQMKKLIAELPTLTAPREHEELIIYLATAKEAISAVLMTDREGRQIPVYFVSRTLRGPEINYTPMEKLVLALLSASKRLKRYFQAHTVVVITDQPIKQLLSNSEISGRMLKWKFELEGYDIQYRPRTAIKGQILADFIVERPEEGSPDELMAEPEELPEPWTLFTDGSSCIDGSGAGLILTNPEGAEFTYAMRFRFEATNNEAEYEALIADLWIAKQMGVKNLQAHVDSRLVANQVNGSYIAKESGMVQRPKQDRIHNTHLSKQVLVEELKEKSINKKEILDVVEEEGNTWITPIYEYLAKEILPEDKKKARAVRRKAARYTMINGTLYKKSFLGPWLRCVGPLQANYVLREIHEGSCSMHSGPRSVVAKVIRTGYYWPTMHMDARNLIRECNDCQIHHPVPRNPQQNLTLITSPWPFYKWGIDIAGPFPEGPGKVKFLIVAIDYFTKWIEAKAVATITGNQVKKFVWDNIVCRFGLPGEIISDNGKQFRDNPFKDWCENPFANASLSKDWIEELPHVLWAHRTMIKSSNGETPFSLTYGTEAVIPAEIGMPTLRTTEIDLTKNNEALGMNLDLIEERREQAAIQEAKSKKKMEKYYNSRVRGTSFKPGDMVYRSNEASHARDEGKLGPKWEGPYEVKESLGKGAYKLKDCKGNEIPRTWNICNLKKCYIHEV
ncbi:reverse transcriptase domain-containing protein [Tanacetum coccineum]